MRQIKTNESLYHDGDVCCHGFIAYPEKLSVATPCVMVAHDWTGRDENACHKAIELAKMGYVGFAIDMYGNGQLGADKEEKRALMTPFKENRSKLFARIHAAYRHISRLSQVNAKKIAAIGYCFGGLCVLDLARSENNIQGVVSFHGLLTSSPDFENSNISSKILILHGYDDPLVPPKEVVSFAEEMTQKNADWQIHMYGLTAHSFTNPLANDNEMGLHYNQAADKRSWKSTTSFLQEILSH